MLWAANMDTSVRVGDVDIPSARRPDVPSDRRVHNLGLMQQSQNYLIGSGVVAMIGAILLAAGWHRRQEQQPQPTKPSVSRPSLGQGASSQLCPACGARREGAARYCHSCGQPFLSGGPSTLADRITQLARQKELEHSALQRAVSGPPLGQVCIACGARRETAARFCHQCGQTFPSGTASSVDSDR